MATKREKYTNNQESINFYVLIQSIVDTTGLSYMDAILQHVERNDLEIETISKLINPTLKFEIEKEAKKLNLLKYVDDKRTDQPLFGGF